MSTTPVDLPLRPLVPADLDWVVDLAARRGQEREPFAPRFWRRAPDARVSHAKFLGLLIEDPGVPSIRTDNGFAFGLPRPGHLLIDDMAMDDEAGWPRDGRALARSVAGTSSVRLVCPVPEPARTALARSLGFALAETWWHRDLDEYPKPEGGAASDAIEVPGGRGRLVQAPPVYAPGGPVLLVTELRDALALTNLEQRAATAGAPVAVVTQHPDDHRRAELLTTAGYKRTCDFYAGTLDQ